MISGPHFRCPEDKPVWMCVFYLIDAYKARKWRKIPEEIRSAIGYAKTAVKTWKGILFPGHFKVKDAKDAIVGIAERFGLRAPELRYVSGDEASVDDIVLPGILFIQRPLAAIQDLFQRVKGFGSSFGIKFGRTDSGQFNLQDIGQYFATKITKIVQIMIDIKDKNWKK